MLIDTAVKRHYSNHVVVRRAKNEFGKQRILLPKHNGYASVRVRWWRGWNVFQPSIRWAVDCPKRVGGRHKSAGHFAVLSPGISADKNQQFAYQSGRVRSNGWLAGDSTEHRLQRVPGRRNMHRSCTHLPLHRRLHYVPHSRRNFGEIHLCYVSNEVH